MGKAKNYVLFIVLAISFIYSCTSCSTLKNINSDSANLSEESNIRLNQMNDPMYKYEPKINFTAFKMAYDQINNFPDGDSYENNLWTRSIRDELGIDVKYLWVESQTQYDQKISIAIASADLPEMIPIRSLTTLKQLVNSGVALDLTEILKEYASPLIKSLFDADQNTALSQVTLNGKIYGLPQISGNSTSGDALYIRKDWLENLGMKAPQTMDELFAISEAFTYDDPDKNGKDDTYGLTTVNDLFGGMANLDGFFAAYNAYPQCGANDAWLKDPSGRIVNGSVQREVKSALRKLSELYKKGILDNKFVYKDETKVAESIVSGEVGIIFGLQWLPFYPLSDLAGKDTEADILQLPLVSFGYNQVKQMVGGSLGELIYVVNKSSKHPEAAVKIYNYFYSKDYALSKDYDADYHTQVNAKYSIFAYSPVITGHPMQNISIFQGVEQYFRDTDSTKLNAWTKSNVEDCKKFLEGDRSKWGTYHWIGPEGSISVFDSYLKNNKRIMNEYIYADTNTLSKKGATLKKLRIEAFTKIIMGVAPVDAFDVYVANWKLLGGDQITDEINSEKR